jgi:hypothetical protein
MDNLVIPYKTDKLSSDESSSSGEYSSDEENNLLLTNNIGIYHNTFDTKNVKFMNMNNPEEYEKIRNKYFTPEILKIRLLIDTKNLSHDSTHNTSNYTIHFNKNDNNNSGGYDVLTNVIGFKLIKAIIPNSTYQVNNNNKNIIINHDNTDISINLNIGSYTFEELGDELVNQLLSATGKTFTIEKDLLTFKYTLSWTHSESFYIKWLNSIGYSHRLFGALNVNDGSDITSNTVTFPNVIQQNNHFVDLVIPEIPYISCKKNPVGYNIIDRIPLDENSGTMIYFVNDDINYDNYFHPIILNKLTIQLYEDTHQNFYECQNNDNSFEFEITILNKNISI